MNILSSLGNLGSTKIILTSNDLFLWTSYREQGCPCVRKARRCPQIMKTNGRRLKLVEVCSLKFSYDYFQYEIADGIEVNILFHRSLLCTRCLLDISPEPDRIWPNIASRIRVCATHSEVRECRWSVCRKLDL